MPSLVITGADPGFSGEGWGTPKSDAGAFRRKQKSVQDVCFLNKFMKHSLRKHDGHDTGVDD